MIWGSEEDEVLVGLRNLFLEDEDMDCSVIVKEEEEEEGLVIQTVEKGVAIRICTATPSRDRRDDWFEHVQVAHKLRTNPMCPPVKQRLRKFKPDKAVKGQALADHLAKNPIGGEYEPLKTYFPNEEVSFVVQDIAEASDRWRMVFDGAANFKGVGIGAVLILETGQHYSVSVKLRFPCTNNMAEYEACILGLNLAVDMNIQELLVIGYSDLLMMKRFTKIEFRYVPRIQNEFADALATLSSMIQHLDKNFIDHISIRIHNQPAYCAHVEEETDGNPWFHDIKECLAKREYPEHANHTQKCTLRRLSNHFFQSEGILHIRTPYLRLLRCVDTKEASKLLKEIHARNSGPHMNGFALVKKILRAGCFWMTMETDCIRYVQKYHQCQIHADMKWVPPN
ncbi:uncharacterized protein [Nicotiana tomentosiformis]|uniref:uncharacterized protein n=1 Tax=Nicotiana tomentosiformis TaxID=4098 RepID=UPI00388CA45D